MKYLPIDLGLKLLGQLMMHNGPVPQITFHMLNFEFSSERIGAVK